MTPHTVVKKPYSSLVSILTGIMFCCSQFAVIVDKEGISVAVIIISFLPLLLFGGLGHVKKGTILFISFILVIFLINLALVNEPVVKEYFECFLCFGVPFLLIPYGKVDSIILIRTVFCISLVALPFYLTYNYGYGNLGFGGYESGYLMTMSYRMLILIIACFLMVSDRNCNGIIRIIAIIPLLAYTVLFFVVGSRGAIISLFTFFLLYFIHSSSNRKEYHKRIIITIGLIIFAVVLFGFLIDYIFGILQQYDINILAIERLYDNINGYGSLDTGRSSLYSSSVQGFLDSPIIGQGIGSSNNYKGYPHNLFLQIMEEGGLLFLVPFVLLIIKGVSLLLKRKTENIFFTLLLIVFCSGVIQLLFSFQYWGSFFFWSFIGLVLNSDMLNHSVRRYENTNSNGTLCATVTPQSV